MNTRTFAALLVLAVSFWGCDSPVRNTTVTTTKGLMSPPPPATTIASISPASAKAGSPDIVVTINGSNFSGGHRYSEAHWTTSVVDAQCCNTSLKTTFVSGTQLTAILHADLLRTPGTARIFVVTEDMMADAPSHNFSNAVPFIINR